jgi:hypothetical protein
MPFDATPAPVMTPIVVDHKAIEELRRGRDFLLANEWIQRTEIKVLAQSRVAVCAIGAMRFGNENISMGGMSNAVRALSAVTGGNIVQYNDYIARTKEEVIAKFDKAIALLLTGWTVR